MPRQTLIDTQEDINWLEETHLKDVPHPAFRSALLEGWHESAPDRIILYADKSPLVTDKPVAVFVPNNDDGSYRPEH